jgi:hypothetical protein
MIPVVAQNESINDLKINYSISNKTDYNEFIQKAHTKKNKRKILSEIYRGV